MPRDTITIDVRVQARSRTSGIEGVRDGRVRIRTNAVPAGGKANRDVISQIARAFGVPQANVEIRRGHTSRLKTLRISEPARLPDWWSQIDA
jgi:hypothetical protein